MIDYSHLNALEHRLFNECRRLEASKTDGERALRSVWVAGIEKEIADERKFLGLPAETPAAPMSSDDLAAALGL